MYHDCSVGVCACKQFMYRYRASGLRSRKRGIGKHRLPCCGWLWSPRVFPHALDSVCVTLPSKLILSGILKLWYHSKMKKKTRFQFAPPQIMPNPRPFRTLDDWIAPVGFLPNVLVSLHTGAGIWWSFGYTKPISICTAQRARGNHVLPISIDP